MEYEHPFSRASAAQQLQACPFLSYPNSVRLSVTRWYCIKTAERIVMIFSPHDSPFILVFTADARFVGNSQLSCYYSLHKNWPVVDCNGETRSAHPHIRQTQES